jgi:hypothetical protein
MTSAVVCWEALVALVPPLGRSFSCLYLGGRELPVDFSVAVSFEGSRGKAAHHRYPADACHDAEAVYLRHCHRRRPSQTLPRPHHESRLRQVVVYSSESARLHRGGGFLTIVS